MSTSRSKHKVPDIRSVLIQAANHTDTCVSCEIHPLYRRASLAAALRGFYEADAASVHYYLE